MHHPIRKKLAEAASLLLCALLAVNAPGALARADSPLPMPADVIRYSTNHKYLVVLRVASNKGFVCAASPAPGGKRRLLWWFRGWAGNAFVSGDGRCAALGASNLLDLSYKPTDPLVTFYFPASAPHAVSIAEALGNHPKLTRTVSHWSWGACLGFDPANKFILRADQGRILRINPL